MPTFDPASMQRQSCLPTFSHCDVKMARALLADLNGCAGMVTPDRSANMKGDDRGADPANHRDPPAAWRGARVAVQPELGVWSERFVGPGARDLARADALERDPVRLVNAVRAEQGLKGTGPVRRRGAATS